MAFPTDDIYLGPKSFGPRKGHEGIIWHTTESSGPSRASAVGTAEWQKSNPGSYNFIIYDGGLLLTVPYLEASGGVNPASASWAPERFPWLKDLHSASAYADPNGYLMNVAFSGKAAELKAGMYPFNMIDTAARLIIWMEDTAWGKDDSVHSAHSDWQSNRSDPGSGVITKILERYTALRVQPPPLTPQQRLARKDGYFDKAGLEVRALEKYAIERGWEPALRPYIERIRTQLRAGRRV